MPTTTGVLSRPMDDDGELLGTTTVTDRWRISLIEAVRDGRVVEPA